MTDDSLTILVTGGTGTLGRAFADVAVAAGHRVRILSRREPPDRLAEGREWSRGDLATGDGLRDAVRGVDVVLHAASDPSGNREEVDVEGTRRLLDIATDEDVDHVIYPSIVGADRIPLAYYAAKVRAENLVAESGLPYTTVRITQFHTFIAGILSGLARLPVMILPRRARIQSIEVREVATRLLDQARNGPSGRAPPIAGPEVRTLAEMARSWCRILGKRRWVVPLPLPGRLGRALREGRATAPERAVGVESWESWLRRRNHEGAG